MIQSQVKEVVVCSSIFQMIDEKDLKTLPIHSSLLVRPGELICFECFESSFGTPCEAWVYAIAERVEVAPSPSARGIFSRYNMVRFRVISDLSDIVLY